MVLEIAHIHIKAGQAEQFEAAFREAERLLVGVEGYIRHELHRCVEQPDRYVLLAHWRRVEDHTVGFRGSPRFQEWRRLIGPFFDGVPEVLHYQSPTGWQPSG